MEIKRDHIPSYSEIHISQFFYNGWICTYLKRITRERQMEDGYSGQDYRSWPKSDLVAREEKGVWVKTKVHRVLINKNKNNSNSNNKNKNNRINNILVITNCFLSIISKNIKISTHAIDDKQVSAYKKAIKTWKTI